MNISKLVALILAICIAVSGCLISCITSDPIDENGGNDPADPGDGKDEAPDDIDPILGTHSLVIDGRGMISENTDFVENKYGGKILAISLVDVMTHYGFTFDWSSDVKASVSRDSARYELDLENVTLLRVGDAENLLELGMDVSVDDICQPRHRDIVLDWYILESVMQGLGDRIFVRSFDNERRAYILTELSPEEQRSYNVVINGRKLCWEDVIAYHDDLRALPLIKVLTECGIKVDRLGDKEAVVKRGNDEYIISLEDSTVRLDGEEVELGLAGGDSPWYQEAHSSDLYCTTIMIRALLHEMTGRFHYLFDLDSGVYIIYSV